MLEIVLLDKYAEADNAETKMLLKQRLGTLMTPKGMQRDELHHQQLKLIDHYLIDESGKAALKSAIDLIKPTYMEYLSSLLNEAGRSLGAEMNIPDSSHYVMVYNHMSKMNPNLAKSQALQRLWSYSKQRENTNLFNIGVPHMSPSFKQKELLNSFGHFETTEHFMNTPVEKQQEIVKKSVEQ